MAANLCLDGFLSPRLLKLSKSGHLSRERLITCTFDALERDFNHYRAKWFTTFHDQLAVPFRLLHELDQFRLPPISSYLVEIQAGNRFQDKHGLSRLLSMMVTESVLHQILQ